MLALSVNTIAIERGQKQDDLKVYYTDRETFVEKGQFDTKSYPINEYNLDAENNIVSITIYKNNGTGNQYEYEINLETGSINFKTQEEVVDPNKKNTITYELNGGKFEDDTNIKEYKKGEIVEFISPVREGFAFEGWYLNSDFSGTSISQTTKDTDGDITLYAKWIAETPSDYFDYDGATINGFSTDGLNAFKNGQIKDLVIPKKHGDVDITNIKSSAFSAYSNTSITTNNISIEKLIIQDNITSLNSSSFRNCTSIKELTIPISLNSVYSSGYPAFWDCTGITKITFTKGTGEGVNYNTSGNTKYASTPWYYSRANDMTIQLEEGITSIGSYMFDGCSKIQNLSIPTTVTSIGAYAFYNCSAMVGELNTISNLTSLGSCAFYGCSSITGTLNIPEGLTTIGSNVFAGTSINKLIIHDNVTSLNQNTFNNCTSLTELTIPISLNSVYSSGYPAFWDCTGITKITFTKGTGEGVNYNTSGNTKYASTPWYYSRNNKMTIVLSKDIASIGNYTFNGLTNATFYYTGSQEEWPNVKVGTNNTINIQSYNYTE